MVKLTKEQIRDLNAIKNDPGIWSKSTDAEIFVLERLGLIAVYKYGGWEITNAGRAALNEGER
jgi:hypothetical protein